MWCLAPLRFLWGGEKCVFIRFYLNWSTGQKNSRKSNCHEPEWMNDMQRCARCTDGGGFEPRTFTNACGHVCKYVDQKGLAAMLTSIQSAGVKPEVNLRIKKWESMQGIHPGFETQGKCHQKSKTGYHWPHKRDYVLQNFFEKKVPAI